MATVSDIDAKALVRRFLERPVVSGKADAGLDSTAEVQALLESVAIAFLLRPQTALNFVLMAGNSLRQVVQANIALVDYLLKTINDLDNPNTFITDTSDLTEAQTALLELDRIGKIQVQPFSRFKGAVQRFLDNQLAKSLKRRGSGELERSGNEARQDLLLAIQNWQTTHELMIKRIAEVVGSVDDFNGVDLQSVVSTKTLTRVRQAVKNVTKGAVTGAMSKTVMALELLSGVAALDAISNLKNIYDPLVDSGVQPLGRTVLATTVSQPAQVSLAGPFDFSADNNPWQLNLGVDPLIGGGTFVSLSIPYPSLTGSVFLVSAASSAAPSYVIPAGSYLYLQVTSAGGAVTIIYPIALPVGASTIQTLVTVFNTAMSGTGVVCVELYPNSGRFLFVGQVIAGITQLVVLQTVPGVTDGLGGYTPPAPSAHQELGFQSNQTSDPLGVFSAATLADLLTGQSSLVTFTAKGTSLIIASVNSAPGSSLGVGLGTSPAWGLTVGQLVTQAPTAVLLEDASDSSVIDPATLDISEGAWVELDDEFDSARSLRAAVAAVQGNQLTFASGLTLPRTKSKTVRVLAPPTRAVQTLLRTLGSYLKKFDTDVFRLQRVMAPLVASSTLAHVNDAKRVLNEIRDKLTQRSQSDKPALLEVLQAVSVTPDQSSFANLAKQILDSLDERSLDRGSSFLKRGKFGTFFGLTKETASTGGKFMKAIEDLGQSLNPTTIEADSTDPQSSGTSDTLLSDVEPPDSTA